MSNRGWLIEHQEITPPNHLNCAERKDEHVVLIDHYDSFTQTIKHYLEVLYAKVSVLQYDDPALNQLERLAPTRLVLSPGPGHPREALATHTLILKHHKDYPMLGVCLGHQCMVEAFGGEVIAAHAVCHGKQSNIYHKGSGLFAGLPQAFPATRYHSLVAKTVPKGWVSTAWTYDIHAQPVLMAMQHKYYPLFGVQYHPEAILTAHGAQILRNFLTFCV